MAAGGTGRRVLRTKSGEVATASLSIVGNLENRIILRFKLGGTTIQRSIGAVPVVENRLETLKLGWQKIRDEKIAEKNDWEWLVP